MCVCAVFCFAGLQQLKHPSVSETLFLEYTPNSLREPVSLARRGRRKGSLLTASHPKAFLLSGRMLCNGFAPRLPPRSRDELQSRLLHKQLCLPVQTVTCRDPEDDLARRSSCCNPSKRRVSSLWEVSLALMFRLALHHTCMTVLQVLLPTLYLIADKLFSPVGRKMCKGMCQTQGFVAQREYLLLAANSVRRTVCNNLISTMKTSIPPDR